MPNPNPMPPLTPDMGKHLDRIRRAERAAADNPSGTGMPTHIQIVLGKNHHHYYWLGQNAWTRAIRTATGWSKSHPVSADDVIVALALAIRQRVEVNFPLAEPPDTGGANA